ncbi:RNA polymerase sigma factor SigZ [Cohnella caldifontis]|uniref:RNA polymerase sigma factor SigZ n=1 Tax=Cohnella caldifontis TaxID=3027471 RepID=UPI0023ED8553|nr:RNA polymerase sigma factor SigZ [Cohnella sp. YIM B05605]
MVKDVLWEQHYEPIAKFVRRQTRFHPAADDIVQNVFVKAFSKMHGLQDKAKIRAWLHQIARNEIADYFRKVKKTEELPETVPVEDVYDEGDAPIRDAVEGLQNVMKFLPDKYREALELAELRGLSQKDLSERLGISYSGAKSRVQRGREMVKEMMTGCCSIEADRYGNIVDYRVEKYGPPRKPGKRSHPNRSGDSVPS